MQYKIIFDLFQIEHFDPVIEPYQVRVKLELMDKNGVTPHF